MSEPQKPEENKPVRPWVLKFVGQYVSFYRETVFDGKQPPRSVTLDMKEGEVVKVKDEKRDYEKPVQFKLIHSYLNEDDRHVEKGHALYAEVAGTWPQELAGTIYLPDGAKESMFHGG